MCFLEVFMSVHKYSVFITLLFLSHSLPISESLQKKLNVMFLAPTHHSAQEVNTTTIGHLFNAINQYGVPEQGNVSIPNNRHFPVWRFQKGLPKGYTEPIFIHSCPRDNTLQRMMSGGAGHSLLCSNAWLKGCIANGPFVTFDHQFDQEHFDFGAGESVANLNTIYKEVIANNPQADIVIAGTCIGAKVVLELLAAHPTDSVKAVILESPFADIKKVMKRWGARYTPFVPWSGALIRTIFKGIFPKIKKAPNTLGARLANIPKDVPILIAHLQNDSFCSDNDMVQIVNALRKRGNQNIYLLVIKDKKLSHGRLNTKKIFTQASNAFLAAHNLPHDALLAQEGKETLAIAQRNACAIAEKSWIVLNG